MFIDYVTLLLINMAAGLFLLACYIYKGLGSATQTKWVPGFAIVGFIALTAGFHMVWTWPLPGSYNSAFGEMSVFFGALFLGAALALWKGWELVSLVIYSVFAGSAAIIIGARIIDLKLTSTPILSGIGFILTGSCGILAALAINYKKNTILKFIVIILLLVSALIWARIGYKAYWDHMSSFSKWMPVTMHQPQ